MFDGNDFNRKNDYDYRYPDDSWNDKEEVVSVGNWIGVLIVLAIPIINIIMYLYWAFSDSSNDNLKNFARASLILGLVGLILGLMLGGCGAIY